MARSAAKTLGLSKMAQSAGKIFDDLKWHEAPIEQTLPPTHYISENEKTVALLRVACALREVAFCIVNDLWPALRAILDGQIFFPRFAPF